MTKLAGKGELEREPTESVIPDPILPQVRATEIIDTDFHFRPEWDDIKRYMPEPFKSEWQRYPVGTSNFTAEYSIGRPSNGQDVLGVATTAEDILRVADEIGVNTVVFSPGYTGPQGIFNEPYVTALASAYNDFVQTEVLPVSDRLKAEIMVNFRTAEDGAREIRKRAPDERFVSVYTEFGGSFESIGSAPHDPLFDAAAEFDLPVSIHVGSFFPNASQLGVGGKTWTEVLGIHGMSISMAYIGSLVMQGAFDKYPGLNVLLKEGGYWWLADFMLRCDEIYLSHPGDIKFTERKLATGEKWLKKLPSEYVLDHVRAATQPMCLPQNPEDFERMMRACHGEDILCYSSDWPHATFDPANWVFENPRVLTPEVQTKILSGNAKKLFKRLA